MDISDSIVPKSDQANADDFLSGPRTVTITGVRSGTTEQPVEISLAEFPGRPFKPSKTVRRILVSAWGPEASTYTGHRMTLFNDPTVKWGGMAIGGIRVSALSHIDKPMSLALTVTKGKRAMTTVEPLADATPVTNPNAELLAEIGALADRTPGGRKGVAAGWAETHEGESLRDATDLGGLELLRDDLKVSAS